MALFLLWGLGDLGSQKTQKDLVGPTSRHMYIVLLSYHEHGKSYPLSRLSCRSSWTWSTNWTLTNGHNGYKSSLFFQLKYPCLCSIISIFTISSRWTRKSLLHIIMNEFCRCNLNLGCLQEDQALQVIHGNQLHHHVPAVSNHLYEP